MMTEQPGPANWPDPWKSFRGVMAGTLILEAIVVLLALLLIPSNRFRMNDASRDAHAALHDVDAASGRNIA